MITPATEPLRTSRSSRPRLPRLPELRRCVSRSLCTMTCAMLLAVVLPVHAAEPPAAAEQAEAIILREGDELLISFPAAPNLNLQQKIRSDGKITLPLIGDVPASGMSPADLKQHLMELYAPQLVTNEVTVMLLSRSFYIYVNGASARTGRVDFDRPVDLFEAVMAAGFNDGVADLKNVRIIRLEDGAYRRFLVNVQDILDARNTKPFPLKQGDMVVIPTRLL